MSLDKAIESGKEHREPYRGAKRIDRTCRNHGSCEWCKGNRMHQIYKEAIKALDKYSDWEYNEYQKRGDKE